MAAGSSPGRRGKGAVSLKPTLQHAALTAYALLARTGLMDRPWARRLFLAAYSAYKTWIEAGPVQRLQEFVPPGSTVVDVGANVGFFTLKFARWVGEYGSVIAIEPDLDNVRTLAAKARAARLAHRVRLYRAAAAAKPGAVGLQRNELHPGDHRITFASHEVIVPAVTVDGLVAEAENPNVSLIKIDVQGAEMLVLEGSATTLANMRPALFVEVDDRALRQFDSSASALVTRMAASGYEMHGLVKYGPPQKLSYDELLAGLRSRAYMDVLFLPK